MLSEMSTEKATKRTRFGCSDCNKTYCNRNKLMQHMNRTHSIEKHGCFNCLRRYGDKPDLVRHFNISACQRLPAKPTPSLWCFQCLVRFPHRPAMLGHIRRQHLNLKYPCDHCEKQFNTPFALRSHIRRSLVKVYRCFHCCTIFSRDTITTHLRNRNYHQGCYTRLPTRGNYCCFKCGEWFPFLSKLTMHLRRQLEVRCRCFHCFQVFTAGGLFRHLKRRLKNDGRCGYPTRNGPRPPIAGSYTCFQCGKWFPLRTKLVAHFARKRKVCCRCFYCFNVFTAGCLNRHLRRRIISGQCGVQRGKEMQKATGLDSFSKYDNQGPIIDN